MVVEGVWVAKEKETPAKVDRDVESVCQEEERGR
jgi:hypothetical protein